MFSFRNPASGKELFVSRERVEEVFGKIDGVKKFLCLPCSGEIKIQDTPGSVQMHIQETFRKRKMPGTCVIRMGGIGDLIMLSSGLREFKKRMQDGPLTFATLEKHVPFMKSLGIVDRCISLDTLPRYEFKHVIDLRFKVEPPQLGTMCTGDWADYMNKDRSDVFDEIFGVYPCQKRFEIPVNERDVKRMRTVVGTDFVLLNGSMVSPARSVIPRYIEPLAKMIVGQGISVVLCGASMIWNEGLKEIAGDGIINLIDKTNLSELIALVSLARLVITPDTGTLHIAGVLRKPTIGLFGNIHPRTRISYYLSVHPLYLHGSFPCQPCGDLHPCMQEPEKGSKCMALLTPKVIFETVQEELKRRMN